MNSWSIYKLYDLVKTYFIDKSYRLGKKANLNALINTK